MITIYTLSHKSTGIPFYVGATKTSLNRRFSGHIVFLKSININPKETIIEAIDNCDISYAAELELFWIQQLKSWGFNLANKRCHSTSYVKDRKLIYLKNKRIKNLNNKKIHEISNRLKKISINVFTEDKKAFENEKLCSQTTLHNYINGNAKSYSLAIKIYNFLNNRIKKRQIELNRI